MAHAPGTGQELDLVLRCARTRLTGPAVETVRSLASRGVDWDRVLFIGSSNGVTPLLSASLRQAAPDIAPSHVLTKLESECRCWTAGGLGLASELGEVMELLTQNGIRAIAFKGPTLAAMAYGKLSWRPYRDLDILLMPEDLPRAIELLKRRRYGAAPKQCDVTTSLRADKHFTLVQSDTGVFVELHWRIAKPSFSVGVDFDELWDRREVVPILDHRVACPGAEDLWLILSVHGAAHCWSSLKWICDMAELLQARPDLDWPGLMRRSQQMGCRRMLLVGLFLARDLLGAELPPGVSERLGNDRLVASLAAPARGTLLMEEPPDDAERWLTDMAYRERLADRLCLLFYFVRQRLAPGKRDHDWVRLPKFLYPLYYLIRPVRLFRESWTATLQPLLFRAFRS